MQQQAALIACIEHATGDRREKLISIYEERCRASASDLAPPMKRFYLS